MTIGEPVKTTNGWSLFMVPAMGGWNWDWQNGHGQSVRSGWCPEGDKAAAQREAESELAETMRAAREMLAESEPPLVVVHGGRELFLYSDDVQGQDDVCPPLGEN